VPKAKVVFKLGELFCGPGGLALAATEAKAESGEKQFRISHAWATDYDADTCETYRENICPTDRNSVICEDIRKLNLIELADISEVDGMAFGFPCNDFSVVGEQKGIDGVYGPLYSYCVKALQKLEPKWFLAENVAGLRNANEGKAFETIVDEFFAAGYSVVPHLYRFDDYGVPQSRRRIMIVGVREDQDWLFRVPSPEPFSKTNVSCRAAIETPPIKPNATNHELTVQSKQVIERLRYIKPGQNVFSAELPDSLKLNVKGARISQIYKRLDPEKPAYTITGSGGGGTHVYHWKEDRALTNRERARLQSFPDHYAFSGSKESVRKQIGMAVPPAGAKVVFEAILKSSAGIKYKSIEPNLSVRIKSRHLATLNATGVLKPVPA
jgi:DNA (cytosine-5)-methyltransferase 1